MKVREYKWTILTLQIWVPKKQKKLPDKVAYHKEISLIE